MLGRQAEELLTRDAEVSRAQVRLRCVRCLEPVAVSLHEDRRYRLVGSEQQALAQDPEDDEFDLLAITPRLEAIELLEDELIMALPLAPRHDECRAPGPGAGSPAGRAAAEGAAPDGEPERPNPFAVLARLRRADPGNDENPA